MVCENAKMLAVRRKTPFSKHIVTYYFIIRVTCEFTLGTDFSPEENGAFLTVYRQCRGILYGRFIFVARNEQRCAMTSPSHKKIPPIQNSELRENKRVKAPRQIFVFLLWRGVNLL